MADDPIVIERFNSYTVKRDGGYLVCPSPVAVSRPIELIGLTLRINMGGETAPSAEPGLHGKRYHLMRIKKVIAPTTGAIRCGDRIDLRLEIA